MNLCAACHESADKDDPDTYHEVTSWVNGPKLDGPKLREQTGRLMHKKCVDAWVKGQAFDQPDLFDLDDDDPYDKPVLIQGHSHSEPICAWPDCTTYLTRDEMKKIHDLQ